MEQKSEKGVIWFEIFLAFLLAKAVQTFLMPTAFLMILVPIAYVLVYFTVGKWIIRRYLTKKIW